MMFFFFFYTGVRNITDLTVLLGWTCLLWMNSKTVFSINPVMRFDMLCLFGGFSGKNFVKLDLTSLSVVPGTHLLV